MFIIKDWAGNHCFPNKEFKTFEDGWIFLMSKFNSDIELGEFWVTSKEDE